MRRLALIASLALTLCLPAGAHASFGFLPGAEGLSASAQNKDTTPTTQAGAHPYALRLDIGLNTTGPSSDGDLRDLRLSLPPGFLINPSAAEECLAADFKAPRVSPHEASASGESCPNSTQVGVIEARVGSQTRHFGLFNLTAPFGSPFALGFAPFGKPVVLVGKLREGDSGLDLLLDELPSSIDLQSVKLEIWGTPWQPVHDEERGNCLNEQTGGSWGTCLVFDAASAPESLIKSYLTLPTTPCGVPLGFSASALSWQGATASASASAPALAKCNKSLSTAKVQLMSDAAAVRTGLAFNLAVNDGGGITNPAGIARPAIKKTILSLPEGLTINPSLGAGLGVCGEAEFARESAASAFGAGCPSTSKIGDVKVEGALGLSEPLIGALFVAKPYENPYDSLLALYMVARSERRGLIVKSIGKLEPEPRSGRLTATFDQLPRLLYTHFSLTLREGQRSTLLSPPTCGSYLAGLALSSWAEPEVFRSEQSAFAIVRGDGGAPCPAGGIPPFSPGLLAGSINAAPAAHTPLYLRMTRSDSEQEITGYSASFPPGLLAKIAGVGRCPDAAIEAAKGRSGAQELASPSCPASSQIGRTMAGYGVGGTLAWAPGNLYLAGPWHGAPLSVVAIDAATIGPFDLGVVVVRQAIRVDTQSAQVIADGAASDPIPHILAGIPIHVRDIRVYIDRPDFTLNPTSCDPMQIRSTLTGSGADLFEKADDPLADSIQRFQLLGCSALGFKPRLTLRLKGGTKRASHPSLIATYAPRSGDANLKSAAVALPPSLFLAQEHIDEVCTRAQYSRGACPKGSVYGRARAITPLLDQPLEGPVYVRSSSHLVPDLVADLRGNGLNLDLIGRIDSRRGGIRARFEALPDAPVTKFTMTLPGGKRSLLTVADGLCAAPQRATARLIAQSNATAILRPKLRVKCPKAKRQPKKRKKPQRASASELTQEGNLRVSFEAGVTPKRLPRQGEAPIAVSIEGKVTSTDGAPPPQMQTVEIALNKAGRLDRRGLAVCHIDEIQPATTANALEACGQAKVGEGSFGADILIPEQSPFPSEGKVIAFNGVEKGRPVIFAHVYGTDPVPTSFTLALRISRAKGRFGTVLSARLPEAGSDAAVVTGISLRLHRTYRAAGERRSFLSAGCPAPEGFSRVLYPLAKASFGFVGAKTIRSPAVVGECRVRAP